MQKRACGARAERHVGRRAARTCKLAIVAFAVSFAAGQAEAGSQHGLLWSCPKRAPAVLAYKRQSGFFPVTRLLAAFQPGSMNRGPLYAQPMRYSAAAPMPPVITHSIQRNGDPLPTLDPRAEETGDAPIKLAADAPQVLPTQPSPEEREKPSAENMAPAPETPKVEEAAPEAPKAEEPAPSETAAPDTPAAPEAPATPETAQPAPEAMPAVLPRLSSPPFAAPTAEDRTVISQCRTNQAAAGNAADACIGKVADPCAEGVGTDAAATNACVERETRVWAEKLDESLGLLKGRLGADKADELAQVQESWVDFRQRNCAFYSSFFSGPLALAQAGYCIMRETARRSIEIDSLLTQAEQR